MGESGQIVKFAMSAEELAAEDAELARLAAIRGAKSRELQNRVAKFELGESGIVIEFPVESDEIAIADTDFSEDPSITNLDRKGIRIAGSVNRCSISNQG